MTAKLLFWNINGKGNEFIDELEPVVQDTDILLLAETKIDDSEIRSHLNMERVEFKSFYDEHEITPKIYANIGHSALEHYSTAPSKRLCFYILKTKEIGEVILSALHFPSKKYYEGNTQLNLANTYANWIRDTEKLRNNNQTLVVGDFNMNPFEEGMIQPHGFNSTLSGEIAKNGPRVFHFENYQYFYNPMWNWLGDREHNSGNKKVPGSFFHKSTGDVNQIYWNVFDKVIVRPDLIDIIDYSTLKIFDPKGTSGEKTSNNFENYSDHYPLSFRLKTTPYGT